MDFQGDGSLFKNRIEPKTTTITCPSPDQVIESTESPTKKSAESKPENYCELELQIRDLCLKVSKLNNLNEAIQLFSSPQNKPHSSLEQIRGHSLEHQIQLTFQEFLHQQIEQVLSYSNIQKCILSADSVHSKST